MTNEFYMRLALNEAWKYQILTFPNPAVGCVVADMHGKILSINSHKKAGLLHAEANAVFVALCEISDEFLNKFLQIYEREFGVDLSEICKNPQNLIYGDFFENSDAVSSKSRFANQILEFKNLNANFVYEFITQNHDNLLKNAIAFVTLEPCSHMGKTPSCASLLASLGLGRVVIGVSDTNQIASGGTKILQNANISVKMGVCKEKAQNLIAPFRAWQSGNFSFFKLAMSLNGVISGGKISGEYSHIHMHSLRAKVDAIAIGGGTVRTDRPLLDTRLVGGGANPDIFIYSHGTDFDKSIPLFGVAGRKVSIVSSLSEIRQKPLVMIEGGENLLRNLPVFVEYFLIYFSDRFIDRAGARLELSLQALYMGECHGERYGWFKRKS